MREWICLGLFLASALASSARPINDFRPWRVGATYSGLTTAMGPDTFGQGWGGGLEYSFSDRLTCDDALPGDISIAGYFRQFRHNSAGVVRTANYTSLSLKWRGGAGANAGFDGLYGGVGAGVVWVSINPAIQSVDQRQGVTKFEWSAFGGLNFARHLYAEVGYSNISDSGINGVNFLLGVRF